MKILVSACLLGVNCKYNQGNNLNKEIVRLLENHEVIKVCPEDLIFSGIKRNPCEIRNNNVFDINGKHMSNMFNYNANEILNIAKINNIDICIMKDGSPSCGVHTIYDGNFNSTKISGQGITSKLLIENGYKVFSEKDINNLILLL